MQPIYYSELVASRSADDFDQALSTAYEKWDNQNVDVEIQFSTAINQNTPLYSALLVVRRRANA